MKQVVLVLNVGSSSIKYQLLELDPSAAESRDSGTRLATGLVDRIGGGGTGTLTHKRPGTDPYEITDTFADHEHALAAVLAAFRDAGPALDTIRLTAVGHRVVHGGTEFTQATVLDEAVLGKIRDLIPLAPLHNPANITGIEGAGRAFPGVPQVAVFDTAFHQTLPAAAHTYAVPEQWRERYAVRRYGFHGTSHEYVSRRAAAVLGRSAAETNVIVLHLGNGASVSAIEGGRSVETSMGLTPLEGLVMGTRSGDIDPAIPAYLERVARLDAAAVDEALNRESGLLGLAGSNDLRDVKKQADGGDPAARLAIDVYCHRIRKYVGAYYAVLGRVDAVVFTAGVGENDPLTRERSLAGLERLGIAVDRERNESGDRDERFISPDGAEVAVLVVPTDEELEIARQTLAVVG
ncbi:acetate kinase [Actinospica sp.]|jgi:acetate kinase|uniref:acetate/propionate family kinase n=1 Tax=Actinospica sp. TaxID=1872142 RepID=UPI002C5A50D9|nr:acetate kinase [Actinospica sp.]HWG25401.1 acetate kinase [Actinospica sp.]